MSTRLFAVLALALMALGCGAPAKVQPRDVRVPIPDPSDAYIDFVTPEAIFNPGEEKMLCTTLTYDGPTTAFSKVESLQGKFGHHIVLLGQSDNDPTPPGTTYDCTKMTNFQPYAIPLDAFPPGYGTELLSGKKLIIQFHYVNTGPVPILVRDVIRLQKMDPTTVVKWMSVYATNQVGFSVPSGSTGTSVTFECALPYDVELIAFGGHMHENGSSFVSQLGDGTTMADLYSVPAWNAEYRDSPPINLYVTAPKQLHQGNVLRTTCTWTNTTDHALTFPEEMCATFGLVAGTRTPVVCTVPQ